MKTKPKAPIDSRLDRMSLRDLRALRKQVADLIEKKRRSS